MALTPAARAARPRWWPGGLAWALWALAIAGLAVVAWLDQLLRQTGRSELVVLGLKAIPPVLGWVSAVTVGAMLAGRRPRHPVGWLLLLTPTGTLPSPRWRWWPRVTVATLVALVVVVPLAARPAGRLVQPVDSPQDLHAFHGVLLAAYQTAMAVTNLALVAAAASLVVAFATPEVSNASSCVGSRSPPSSWRC